MTRPGHLLSRSLDRSSPPNAAGLGALVGAWDSGFPALKARVAPHITSPIGEEARASNPARSGSRGPPERVAGLEKPQCARHRHPGPPRGTDPPSRPPSFPNHGRQRRRKDAVDDNTSSGRRSSSSGGVLAAGAAAPAAPGAGRGGRGDGGPGAVLFRLGLLLRGAAAAGPRAAQQRRVGRRQQQRQRRRAQGAERGGAGAGGVEG